MALENMNQELIKCPCCERMVPANNIELTFKRPDDIANMDEEAIEERCRYNNDIYILDNEYYYVRAILPLPVQEKGSDYCLGVWVQLEKESFDKVYDLWDEEDQSNEPPISCILANKIPLTTSSKNSSALLQLIGAKSRPKIKVLNKHCSLYQQQNSGITIHQASEYSDICK